MRHSRGRAPVLASMIIAAVATTWTGCGSLGGISPSLTIATSPALAPFIGSVFSLCTVYVTDSGRPGRAVRQDELQISPNTIGPCPQHIILSNPSNSPRRDIGEDRYVYYLGSFTPTNCGYIEAQSPSDDFAQCKLAGSTDATSGSQLPQGARDAVQGE